MARLGVIHYNFPGFSFDDFLRFASETGYGFVELMISDVWREGESDPEASATAVKEKVASYGLRVSALGAGNDFVQSDQEIVKQQVERMERVAQLTRILDDDAVIRSEGGQPKDSVPKERWEDAMYECFSRCTDFAERLRVGIAIDNHGLVTNDGDLLHSLLKRIHHPKIGTNLDTMNYRWFGNSVDTCDRYYGMMAPFTLHTHFKDGFGSRQEYRGAALGEGEIHLSKALDALRLAGYGGVYCAEYEGPEPAGGVGYAKCCRWLKENV